MSRIITISREFGSGGRELGKRLAKALGIPCYDHEIIEMIAKENGFNEDYVANVGEKSIEMLHQKELLPLTGYVHGGCSPVGMKKLFPTVFHSSVENLPTVIVSAGKIGYQVEVKPADLMGLVRAETADIIVEN